MTHLDLFQLGVFVVFEFVHLALQTFALCRSSFLLLFGLADDLFELGQSLLGSSDLAYDLGSALLQTLTYFGCIAAVHLLL